MSSPSSSSTSSLHHSNHHTSSAGGSSTTTSGRTTPEPHNLHHHHNFQHHHFHHAGAPPHMINSKVLPHTIYGSSPNSHSHQQQQPRRSSTPSQAFLKPLFFSGFHQQQPHQSNPMSPNAPAPGQSADSTSTPQQQPQLPRTTTEPPRRTSFGAALGSRLGALSALGVSSGWGAGGSSPGPPSHQTPASPRLNNNNPSSNASSVATSPRLKPIDGGNNSSLSSTSVAGDSNLAGEQLAKPKPQRPVEKRHICVPDGCGGFITVEQK